MVLLFFPVGRLSCGYPLILKCSNSIFRRNPAEILVRFWLNSGKVSILDIRKPTETNNSAFPRRERRGCEGGEPAGLAGLALLCGDARALDCYGHFCTGNFRTSYSRFLVWNLLSLKRDEPRCHGRVGVDMVSWPPSRKIQSTVIFVLTIVVLKIPESRFRKENTPLFIKYP